MKHLPLIFILFVMLSSCGSTKQLSYEELMEGAPAWVLKSPGNSGYYHGVGMASKISATDKYREKARQNALADMAGNISVNISSSSVLNQFEFENNYSDYYKESIKMSTQKYLEGYELVESWENEQQYWVYYRLSKQKYKQIKQERIDKAVDASKADNTKARQLQAQGNLSEALRFQVKSLEEIQDFLGEDLSSEVDGKQVDYSTEVLSGIVSMVQDIRIVYPEKELSVKRGEAPNPATVELQLVDQDDVPIKGATLKTVFSYAPGKVVQSVSDNHGKVRIKLESFDSRRREEWISSTVNFERMVKENTDEMVVRKLLQGVKIPEFNLLIKIIQPVFFIQTQALNPDGSNAGNDVTQELETLLEKDGLGVTSELEDADYILSARINTADGNAANGKYTTSLTAKFVLKDRSEKSVYTKTIDGHVGLGSSYSDAADDAFESLLGNIRINIYPSMYRSVFK